MIIVSNQCSYFQMQTRSSAVEDTSLNSAVTDFLFYVLKSSACHLHGTGWSSHQENWRLFVYGVKSVQKLKWREAATGHWMDFPSRKCIYFCYTIQTCICVRSHSIFSLSRRTMLRIEDICQRTNTCGSVFNSIRQQEGPPTNRPMLQLNLLKTLWILILDKIVLDIYYVGNSDHSKWVRMKKMYEELNIFM